MGNQTGKWAAYVIGAMSVIGFIMQALSEQNDYVKYLGVAVVAGTMIAAFAHGIKSRTVVSRKTMIKRGRQIILSAQSKVVLFGGGLSWANDYLPELKKVSDDGIAIEVVYPLERYNAFSADAKKHFSQRLEALKHVGAQIYSVQLDMGLRCILVDPDSGHRPDHMKILIANHISKHHSKSDKNRYHAMLLSYDNPRQKDLCVSYLSHYCLLQESRQAHKERGDGIAKAGYH